MGKKGLKKRLSVEKRPISRTALKDVKERADANRDAFNKAKVEKAAKETRKVQEAQLKFNVLPPKKKAQLKTVATIITIDTEKDSNRKPKKSLIKRLNVTSSPKKYGIARATANRHAATKAKVHKAALQSEKVAAAKEKANINKTKAAEKIVSALAKAEANRNAVTTSKVNKAAHESEKVEAAKDKANTAEAKAAKAKATARAATVKIITVDVGKSPNKKANKSLVTRLSVTPMRTLAKLESDLAKADANRDRAMKAKTDKAALVTKRIRAIKAVSADEAKAAEKKLEFTLAKADANRNVFMKAKTDKAALISKKIKAIKDQANTDEAKAAEKLISALAKAEANRDAVTKAKANKAAHESEKVEAAKGKANTTKAKAAKAKAELQAAAATIINVNIAKRPNRKADKSLVQRLSVTPMRNLKKLESNFVKAETNRDAVTKAKVNKAAHESEKVEAAKDKANTAEAKAAKAKAEARAATVNIITVDVGKSSKRKKASKGLIKRLSKEIAAPTQEQLEIEKSKADKLKNAITQAKVAKAHAESKKIEVAKEKVAKAQELKRNAILAKHARKTGSRS